MRPIARRQVDRLVESGQSASRRPVELYRAHCIECHDADGRGESAREIMPKIPDFTDSKWQDSREDGELTHSILRGKGLMPVIEGKLEAAEVERIVAFVRGFRGGRLVVAEGEEKAPAWSPPLGVSPPTRHRVPPARTPTPSRLDPEPPRFAVARGLYRRYCLACHGADGRGLVMRASMPEIPDFTDRAWQARGTDELLKANVLDGKNASMPAFGGKITEAEAEVLVEYLRSFGPLARPLREGPDDFDRRFRQLQEELDDLRRQFRALSPPPQVR